MRRFPLLLVACTAAVIAAGAACGSSDQESASGRPAPFGARQNLGFVVCDDIDECSGLAASRQNPGVLWAHNDSGDEPRFFALNTEGQHLGSYGLLDAEGRDWEDMAIGRGPYDEHDFLYAADIGDNKERQDVKVIYRVPEPVVHVDQDPVDTWLSAVETISLRYPDGRRDAECLLLDPRTGDLYIVSKQEKRPNIYRLPYPQTTAGVITAEKVATMPMTQITGGDVSPSGDEILIKTYDAVYLFARQGEEPLWRAFEGPGIKLPYAKEPQGEAIAWKPDGMGYFTLSEEKDKIPAFLYYYPRLTE